jgi:hypothetical protein
MSATWHEGATPANLDCDQRRKTKETVCRSSLLQLENYADDQRPAATLEATVADIIDLTKVREARSGGGRYRTLHEIHCGAAEAAPIRALNAEGRMLLATGVARAALGRPACATIPMDAKITNVTASPT